jgi:hypothetical protein
MIPMPDLQKDKWRRIGPDLSQQFGIHEADSDETTYGIHGTAPHA